MVDANPALGLGYSLSGAGVGCFDRCVIQHTDVNLRAIAVAVLHGVGIRAVHTCDPGNEGA